MARLQKKQDMNRDWGRDIYAAALLDMHGTIQIARTSRIRSGKAAVQYWLRVGIRCTNNVVMRWLTSRYGRGSLTGHIWWLSSREAGEFLVMVLNELKYRKAQAGLAINFQRRVDSLDVERKKTGTRLKDIMADELIWRENAREELLTLCRHDAAEMKTTSLALAAANLKKLRSLARPAPKR